MRADDKRPAFPDHAEARCAGRDPRCRRAGRHVSWEERATTDPARIRAAWTSAPYGIGIATGPSGLLVIDLDQPKPDPAGAIALPPAEWAEPGILDGGDVFALLCQRAGHPAPWDTYATRTGSGGTHLYFTAPTGPEAPELRCTAGHLAWLIDTRAHGGYVVAAPSTVAGRAYVAEDDTAEPAPLPGWLTEALTPRPLPVQAPTPIHLRAGAGDRAGAYLEAAVNRAAEAVRASGHGQHNRALYGAAVQLGQLVAGGALPAGQVYAALMPAATAVGQSEAEATRTIASGLRAGAKRPRTLPIESSTGVAA
ncbi:bifunctional DNA primase/polymerase [Kineosporia mesophila]|uniref:bifunctional DNA primase/polymerase n=1 Tax=Kineosporia mesophila TaxID=566012 RepID=UPI001E3023E9|nr:bifunctional DNA primase/polymerase [Kineosporia mesophila]